MILQSFLYFTFSLVCLNANAQQPTAGGCGTEACAPEQSSLQKQAEALNVLSKSLRPKPRPQNLTSQKSGITEAYNNPKGCFSRSRPAADKCSPKGWNDLSLVERARFVYRKYTEITAAHKLDYSPRILTCKVMKESTFRPQDQAGSSTAAGLSQVTKSTAKDLFNRGKWFVSKVNGFEKITSGEEYYNKMKTSISAQLELGMAVLKQKSMDNKTTEIKSLLAKYYGTKSKSKNKAYAQSIYNCAECIRKNKNVITDACLNKVRN